MNEVHRYSHTPDGFEDAESQAHAQPNTEPQTRVVGGTLSYTQGGANDGQQSSQPVTRHQEGAPGQYTGASVAATYEDRFGKPSVMLPGGMRTGVEVAQRMGLIHKSADGRWVDSVPKDQQAATLQQHIAEPQQQSQSDPGAGIFDAEHDRLHAETVKGLPQWAVDAATGRLVAKLVHGTGSEAGIAERLAKDVGGMDAAKALEHVQNFQRLHEAALEKALAPMGLVGDRGQSFLDTLRANPSKFQDALQQLLYERSAKGFIKEAAEFKRHNPSPEEKQLRAAGWDVAQDPTTGDTLVKAPGSTQSTTMRELAEGKGKPGSKKVHSVPTGDGVMHESFERAGFEVGDFKGEMYVRRDGKGNWVRAADVLNNVK